MRSHLAIFAAAMLFAVGLGVSGMTDANKVIGFLQLDANWDPSLALVMLSAIVVHAPLYWRATRAERPVFADRFMVSPRRQVTPRLLGGAVLFGAGWALGGFCPGPALVSVVSGVPAVLWFVGAMAAGMALWHAVEAVRSRIGRPRHGKRDGSTWIGAWS